MQTRRKFKVLALFLLAAAVCGLLFAAPSASEAADMYVCEIEGGNQYTSFSEAVDAAQDGDIITMLETCFETEPILIDGKAVRLKLGDYNLHINNNTVGYNGAALSVVNGGKLTHIGGGSGRIIVNALGSSDCLAALYVSDNSMVMMNGNLTGVYGMLVYNSSEVRISGVVSGVDNGLGAAIGINAESRSYVNVTGIVHSNSQYGVLATGHGTNVVVNGHISCGSAVGVSANNYAGITVEGDIIAWNNTGVDSSTGAWVTVNGNVTGSPALMGVDRGAITVTGHVSVSTGPRIGIMAGEQSVIKVFGDVYVDGLNYDGMICGVYAPAAMGIDVNVTGYLMVLGKGGQGVSATGNLSDHGTIRISGNVAVINNEQPAYGYGVLAEGGVSVILNGILVVEGEDSVGIIAKSNGNVRVSGDIFVPGPGMVGVFVGSNSEVFVGGDISTGPGGRGVDSAGLGMTTVNGHIFADMYVVLSGRTLFAGDGVQSVTKPGYMEYSDTNGNYVWVWDDGSISVELESIVIFPPDKTEYYLGDALDLTRLEVAANYTDGSSKYVTDYWTDVPHGEILDERYVTEQGTWWISVIYTEGSVTKIGSFMITIIVPVLEDIRITALPVKLDYIEGEALDLTGLEIVARYSNWGEKYVSGWSTDPAEGTVLDALGQIDVMVIYSEGSITVFSWFKIMVEAHTHDYIGVVTEPTCTDKGFTTFTCSVCGDEFIDEIIPANGHTEGPGTVTVPPTATTEGVMTYYCTVCGEVLRTESIPALGQFITVNGIDIEYEIVNGVVVIKPTEEQTKAILNAPGGEIVFDLRGIGSNAEIAFNAGWFKDTDKTITLITDNGSYSVKTKMLYNNSGKTRAIQIMNGKGSTSNN
jgi:hypothetical protein